MQEKLNFMSKYILSNKMDIMLHKYARKSFTFIEREISIKMYYCIFLF